MLPSVGDLEAVAQTACSLFGEAAQDTSRAKHPLVTLILDDHDGSSMRLKAGATPGAQFVRHLGSRALAALEPHFPGLRSAVRLRDVATPLTYWSMARSWRGAFEGWVATPEAMFSHPKKTLHGLGGFCMAGQWVEPGGSMPTAVLSSRRRFSSSARTPSGSSLRAARV